MTIEQINATRDAVIEVIAVIFLLGFGTFFALACMGCFDKD